MPFINLDFYVGLMYDLFDHVNLWITFKISFSSVSFARTAHLSREIIYFYTGSLDWTEFFASIVEVLKVMLLAIIVFYWLYLQSLEPMF